MVELREISRWGHLNGMIALKFWWWVKMSQIHFKTYEAEFPKFSYYKPMVKPTV